MSSDKKLLNRFQSASRVPHHQVLHGSSALPDFSKEHWAWQQRVLKEMLQTGTAKSSSQEANRALIKHVNDLKSTKNTSKLSQEQYSNDNYKNLNNTVNVSSLIAMKNRQLKQNIDQYGIPIELSQHQRQLVEDRAKTAFQSTYDICFNLSQNLQKHILKDDPRMLPAAKILEKNHIYKTNKNSQGYLFFGYRPRSKMHSRNRSLAVDKDNQQNQKEIKADDHLQYENLNQSYLTAQHSRRASSAQKIRNIVQKTRPQSSIKLNSQNLTTNPNPYQNNYNFELNNTRNLAEQNYHTNQHQSVLNKTHNNFGNINNHKRTTSLNYNTNNFNEQTTQENKYNISSSSKNNQLSKGNSEERRQMIVQMLMDMSENQIKDIMRELKVTESEHLIEEIEKLDDLDQLQFPLQNPEHNPYYTSINQRPKSQMGYKRQNTPSVALSGTTTNRIVIDSLNSQLHNEKNQRSKLEQEIQKLKQQTKRISQAMGSMNKTKQN
eukprot:403375091